MSDERIDPRGGEPEDTRDRRWVRRRQRSWAGFAARPVCLSCLFMAVLWLFAFGYGLPRELMIGVGLAIAVMIAVGVAAWRGRSVDEGMS